MRNTQDCPTRANMVRTVEIPSRVFHFVLLLLVGAAILRSAIATRLDSFTYDEPYHIAAGVSYITARDFRLNPEHPPLVKLWVGTLMSLTGFRLSALRLFHDKFDERHFAHEDVFRRVWRLITHARDRTLTIGHLLAVRSHRRVRRAAHAVTDRARPRACLAAGHSDGREHPAARHHQTKTSLHGVLRLT